MASSFAQFKLHTNWNIPCQETQEKEVETCMIDFVFRFRRVACIRVMQTLYRSNTFGRDNCRLLLLIRCKTIK